MSYFEDNGYQGAGAIDAHAPRRPRMRSRARRPGALGTTFTRVPITAHVPEATSLLPQTGGTGVQNTLTLCGGPNQPPCNVIGTRQQNTQGTSTTDTSDTSDTSDDGSAGGNYVATTTTPTPATTPATSLYQCPDGSQAASIAQCPTVSAPTSSGSIPWFWIGAGALALWFLAKD